MTASGAAPRAAGRPKNAHAAREAIVAAADALFYAHGIAAVSIEAIARHAGVTRRTLYYHFSGKDQLVVEHVRLRDRSIRAAAAEASVLDAFAQLDRLFCRGDYHGCAITNAMLTGGTLSRVAGRMSRAHKEALERWFIADVRARRAREPELLGRQLMMLYEGALVTARMRRTPDVAATALAAARTLMRAHGIADSDEPLAATTARMPGKPPPPR